MSDNDFAQLQHFAEYRASQPKAAAPEGRPMEFFDPPLLKYYGGKWKLADWIINHFPPHKIYIEPFCGSASVFLRKSPADLSVLNDLNSHIINFFDVLRTQADALVKAIDLTPFSYQEWRRSFELVDDPLERARRFYVSCWQSFGSGGADARQSKRTGWRRSLSTTRGSTTHEDFNRLDGLWLAARMLKRAQIDCLPAIQCIQKYDSSDALFFVDPPYPQSTRREGRKMYAHEMSDADHRALAETLHAIKGMALISGYDCALYRELYADWTVVSKSATTNGNSQAMEYLWINPRANRLGALPLFSEVQP